MIRHRYSDFMSTWKRLRGEKTRARRLRELIALRAAVQLRVALMFARR